MLKQAMFVMLSPSSSCCCCCCCDACPPTPSNENTPAQTEGWGTIEGERGEPTGKGSSRLKSGDMLWECMGCWAELGGASVVVGGGGVVSEWILSRNMIKIRGNGIIMSREVRSWK